LPTAPEIGYPPEGEPAEAVLSDRGFRSRQRLEVTGCDGTTSVLVEAGSCASEDVKLMVANPPVQPASASDRGPRGVAAEADVSGRSRSLGTFLSRYTCGMTNPDRQRQARRYATLQRRLMLLELALGFGYLIFVQFSGLAVWLRDQAPDPPALGAVFLAGVLAFVYLVLTAPLSYYGGYVLPKRYGLLIQSLGGWLADRLKALVVGGVFGLVVLEALVALLQWTPDYWWLGVAAFLLFLTVVLANLAPVLIVPLFFKMRRLDDDELVRRLTALAEGAGARVRGVYVMEMSGKTTAGNAALMGLGNTRRIVVGDTLLKDYTPAEIEVVLAHELAHHVHRDILKGIVVQTIVTLFGLWLANMFLHWGVATLGLRGVSDLAALPLVALALGIYGLVSQPLTNWYSRLVERAADQYALAVTKDPGSFVSVMTKLHDQNLSEADPPWWAKIWLYDHPPLRERLALAGG
jgi:STE24 endopeptidase